MIFIKGITYKTTVDAARELGVSTKTLRAYISKGIVPKPPVVSYGVRVLTYFPDEYVGQARKRLEKYRSEKNVDKMP